MGDNEKTGGAPKEPELPKDAPQDIKDFVSCKANSVELKPGKVTWLPKFLGEFTPDPNISFGPGADGNSIKITVGLGLDTSITAKVDGNGQLSVDTSDSTVLNEFSDAITGWINDLNNWMKSKGKKFGKLSLKDGKLTLTKENATTALAPAPGEKKGVKTGPFFPNVPVWEKVAGGAVLAAAVIGAFAGLPSDTTSVHTATEVVSVPGVSTSPTSVKPSTPPPVVSSSPIIGDGCVGLFHVPGQYSLIQLFFTSQPQFAGQWTAEIAKGPTGPVSGQGALAPIGHGEIDVRITQFGTYDGLVLTAPGGMNVPIGGFASQFPLDVTSQPKECDPRTQTVPGGASTTPTLPPTNPTGSGSSTAPHTSTITVATKTTESGGFPWSLFLIPGTVCFLWGAYYLDEHRRRDCLEDDDDDGPYDRRFKIDPKLLRPDPPLVRDPGTATQIGVDTDEHPIVPVDPPTSVDPPELPPSSPDDFKPKPPDWTPPEVM